MGASLMERGFYLDIECKAAPLAAAVCLSSCPTLLSWRHKEAGLRQRCRTTGAQNSGGACFALKTTVARHRSRQLEMGRVQVGAARSEEQRRS